MLWQGGRRSHTGTYVKQEKFGVGAFQQEVERRVGHEVAGGDESKQPEPAAASVGLTIESLMGESFSLQRQAILPVAGEHQDGGEVEPRRRILGIGLRASAKQVPQRREVAPLVGQTHQAGDTKARHTVGGRQGESLKRGHRHHTTPHAAWGTTWARMRSITESTNAVQSASVVR